MCGVERTAVATSVGDGDIRDAKAVDAEDSQTATILAVVIQRLIYICGSSGETVYQCNRWCEYEQ